MDTATQIADPTAASASGKAPSPRSLLRGRDFRLLWSAYSVSAVGSEVTVLALPPAVEEPRPASQQGTQA